MEVEVEVKVEVEERKGGWSIKFFRKKKLMLSVWQLSQIQIIR